MTGCIIGCGSKDAPKQEIQKEATSKPETKKEATPTPEIKEKADTKTEAPADLYEQIANDIIALSANPEAKFDYAPDCVVKSIEKNPETGANVVSVIITKELGDNVFPRIIGAVNMTKGGAFVVGMEEDPENVKNV